MFRLPFVLIVILCCSAATCQTRPSKPQVIEVPGPTKYVQIDASLTQECPIEEPSDASPLEAVRVAKARKDSLQACNRDKAAIRAVQGTKVEP